MKFRKITGILLAASMLCGMWGVMGASAGEQPVSQKVDLSYLLDGHFAGGTVDKGNALENWDCIDGQANPQNGQVIQVSSSQQAGWGVAKGALIDKVEFYMPDGTWGVPGWGYMSVPDPNATDLSINEWIILDLQQTYLVDKVYYSIMNSWDNQGVPADLTIGVSDDGVTFDQVVKETGLTYEDAVKNDQGQATGVFEFAIDPVECRYIRLKVTKLAGPIGTSAALCLTELGVYSSTENQQNMPEPLPTTTTEGTTTTTEDTTTTTEATTTEAPEELVFKKLDLSTLITGLTMPPPAGYNEWDEDEKVIAVSNSYESVWMGGTGKAYLIDGKNSPCEWVEGQGVQSEGMFISAFFDGETAKCSPEVPATVTINLGREYVLNQIAFYTLWVGSGKGMPTDFTISVSMDGKNFTDVVVKTDFQPEADTNKYAFTFDEINAQYVRLNATRIHTDIEGMAGKTDMGLTELEVWGALPLGAEEGTGANTGNTSMMVLFILSGISALCLVGIVFATKKRAQKF